LPSGRLREPGEDERAFTPVFDGLLRERPDVFDGLLRERPDVFDGLLRERPDVFDGLWRGSG